MKATSVVLGLLFAILLLSRLTHVNILWAEEDLPMAAAVQMLHDKVLYRDVWFDKPPLTAAISLLWGAQAGWPVRLAGAIYVFLACVLIYRFAREMWSEREGLLAACGLAFFLTFGIPAAVIPLAADLLMLVPHIAAVYLAWRGRAFWSGVAAGVAMLFHSKGLFVLAACALWVPRSILVLAAGFLLPNVLACAWLWWRGALDDYYLQFWKWGAIYAANTFVENPAWNGVRRTLNWAGFHAAVAAGAAWFFWRDRTSDRRRFALWALLGLASVAAGWRFFPRYYFHLLPVVTLAAARGVTLLDRKRAAIVVALLLVPFIRFGPRYALLAGDLATGEPHEWSDVAMNQDSREAARRVRDLARPGDTLFIWGFRPDIWVYTQMPAGTRFIDSQPLTGVFADRHLFRSESVAPEIARANRAELARSRPTFVLDGLSPYNPALSMDSYPELRDWLANYDAVARTPATIVYRLRSTSRSPG